MRKRILPISFHAVINLNEGFHVLVIDDGSPDGTAQIVKIFSQNFPDSYLLRKEGVNWDWVLLISMVSNGALTNGYAFHF